MMKLREWRESDAPSFVKYLNNNKITDNLRDGIPSPYTLSDARDFLNVMFTADASKNLYLAIDVDGEAVGSIGAFVKDNIYRKSAEIGYWLAEPFWSRGIMSAAVRETCAIAFEKFDIVRLFAEPYAYNTGSRRVLEKAGFKLEGILRQNAVKNGVILDSCMYSLLRDEYGYGS